MSRASVQAICALIGIAMLAWSAQALSDEVRVFDKAEFRWMGGYAGEPSTTARWEPVELPHAWHDTDPDRAGYGWYRIWFDVDRVPYAGQALELDAFRSDWVDFYLNGDLIGSSRDLIARAGGLGLDTSLFLTFPASLMRTGRNQLLVHMHTSHQTMNIQGLGRVTLGDARPVRVRAVGAQEWGFYAERSFFAMAFAAGLISLFVWLARREDRVLLWYSVACLSWVAAGALWNVLRWSDEVPRIQQVLIVFSIYGLAVPAVVLALRVAGQRQPLFETALWLFLLEEVTRPLRSLPKDLMIRLLVIDSINGVMLLAGATIILIARRRALRWPDLTTVLALIAMGALMFYEAARDVGWIAPDAPMLRPYHVPLLIFAIGAAIYERHVRAIWRMERSNAELQQRVDEKAREIEAYHAEREERLRQQALIRDRQRILADMHDGLGASLVGLLRYAQAGRVDSRSLERRIKEALQELRIAIDALEPAEGDLGSVLGKLRYRLEPLIESAGVTLVWEADELPPVEALEPSAVFAIQRILLEAVSNAIQHAGARRIRIAAHVGADSAIRVTIEDDGKGFIPAQASTGLGLASMRKRADALGASLEISSGAGGGTVVALTLPRSLAKRAPTAYPEAEAALRA
jgi:signal transduction histidine kinase